MTLSFEFNYKFYMFVAQASVSGLMDFDYPSLADPKIGLTSVTELGNIKKIPLPAELVEQFGRILSFYYCPLL